MACLFRVPIEIAKQRSQASIGGSGAIRILCEAYQKEGLVRGLYKGFGTTVFREVPFSIIQFPLWEYFKVHWFEMTGYPLTPSGVASCGAISGGIAAAITTPLDVLKTRVMLAERSTIQPSALYMSNGKLEKRTQIHTILTEIYQERGISG